MKVNSKIYSNLALILSFLFFIFSLSCDKNLAGESTTFRSTPSDSNKVVWIPFEGELAFSEAIGRHSPIRILNGATASLEEIQLSNEELMPSFNGNSLYFSSKNQLNFYGIYQYDRSTKKSEFVRLSHSDLLYPRFNSSQKKVAYIDNNTNLLIYEMATEQLDTLYQTTSAILKGPVWSHDDSFLLFHQEQAGTNRIYKYDFSTQSLDSISNGKFPDLSSDDQSMIFSTQTSIRKRNLNTSSETVLFTGINVNNPVFSPSDTHIAFADAASGSFLIHIMNADGSEDFVLPKYGFDAAYLFWAE